MAISRKGVVAPILSAMTLALAGWCACIGEAGAQTAPRAPLGPGNDHGRDYMPMQIPSQRRMAPSADDRAPGAPARGAARSGPMARQDQELSAFRGALSAALTRSSAQSPPAKGVLLVNTTNGEFSGLASLPDGGRRFSVPAFGQTALTCEACVKNLRLDFHDGFNRRFVIFDLGSRGYVIVQPLYGLFEILSQHETARLAGVTP